MKTKCIAAGTFTQHEKEKLVAGIVAQALFQKDAFPKASVDHIVMSPNRYAGN